MSTDKAEWSRLSRVKCWALLSPASRVELICIERCRDNNSHSSTIVLTFLLAGLRRRSRHVDRATLELDHNSCDYCKSLARPAAPAATVRATRDLIGIGRASRYSFDPLSSAKRWANWIQCPVEKVPRSKQTTSECLCPCARPGGSTTKILENTTCTVWFSVFYSSINSDTRSATNSAI